MEVERKDIEICVKGEHALLSSHVLWIFNPNHFHNTSPVMPAYIFLCSQFL